MKPLNQLQQGDRITREIIGYHGKIEIEPAFIDPDSDGEDWCDERCMVFFNPINGMNGLMEDEEWEFEVIDSKSVHSKETVDGLTFDNRKIFSVRVKPIKRKELIRYQRIYRQDNFYLKETVSGYRVVSSEEIPITFEEKKYRCEGELLAVRTIFYEGDIIDTFISSQQIEKDYLRQLKESLPKGITVDNRFLKDYIEIDQDQLNQMVSI